MRLSAVAVRKSASPISGRRERRRAATEQRIVNAALQLFSEQGYTNTTVDAIVAAADIGKGTFFNYFASKEHLIYAFGERLVGRLAGAAATCTETPILEQLRAAIHGLVGEWHGNQRLLRSILGAALSSDTMAEHFQGLLARGREHVAQLMAEGQQRGELRNDLPAADLARLLQQSMVGAQLVWSLRPLSDLIATADQALDVLWRGIEAPAPRQYPTRNRGQR